MYEVHLGGCLIDLLAQIVDDFALLAELLVDVLTADLEALGDLVDFLQMLILFLNQLFLGS